MKLIAEVGNRIRLFRKQKGMSQEELGNRLGLTKSYISRLENGKKPISLDRLETIAEVLEVNVDYLLVDKTKLIEHKEGISITSSNYTKEELEQFVEVALSKINEHKSNK